MLDGVYLNSVVQDRFQETVLAQFLRELYRYWAASHDVAHLTGVGVAASPGKQVTNDDEVRSRRPGRAFAGRHCRQGIGGVGLEAFGFAAVLLDGSPGALCRQLEAGHERDTSLGGQSTCKTDHSEAVAPVAEIPGAKLLAMEVGHIFIGLAVLAGSVAELREVRAPCEREQLGF
jgi:hypothetical protein